MAATREGGAELVGGGADLGDDGGGVGVGQRAVGGLQAQAVGQAARPVGDARAAVDVEQLEADEQAAGALADRLLQLLGGNRPRRARTPCRGRSTDAGSSPSTAPAWARSASTDRQVELEDRHPLADLVGVEHAGGDLADGADRRRARRPASPSASDGGRPAPVRWSIRAPTSERRGDLAPHGDRRRRLGAGEDDAEHLPLVGELAGARRVDVTDLEQRHAGAAMRLVEGDGAQAARAAATGAARPRRPRAGW